MGTHHHQINKVWVVEVKYGGTKGGRGIGEYVDEVKVPQDKRVTGQGGNKKGGSLPVAGVNNA